MPATAGKPGKQHAKRKKPATEEHRITLYLKCPEQTRYISDFEERGLRTVQDLGGSDENVLELNCGDGGTTLNILKKIQL